MKTGSTNTDTDSFNTAASMTDTMMYQAASRSFMRAERQCRPVQMAWSMPAAWFRVQTRFLMTH
ncbi:MAG TPA: hypothetical protein VHL11_10290 [Phototrophicaceae bacterium]|nr:hypothetical protein [Phototrophicaceae bacterium]